MFREKNMTINEINYIADYTIVWVLGGLSFLFFAISIAILYFRIKHYIEQTNYAPVVVKRQQ